MAEQHSSASSSKEQMLKPDECEACLLSLSPSKDFIVDPVSGLKAPTSLPLPMQSMPWMGDVLGQPVVTAKESPPWSEEYSLTVDLPVQASPHEHSLCHKMFQTSNALNKHLLTPQRERPHVCSICQQAFKRHDHLNSHILTHQKRKQFQCAELGCQKSYCDSHSLKRHYTSQHSTPFMAPITQRLPPPPAPSAAPQWEPVDKPAAFCGASAAAADYHSIFSGSPPQPKADKRPNSSDYSGFSGYNSNSGLDPQCGLPMNACSEQNLPQPKSNLALGPLRQRVDTDPCNGCTGELHASQWGPQLLPQEQIQTQDQLQPQVQIQTQTQVQTQDQDQIQTQDQDQIQTQDQDQIQTQDQDQLCSAASIASRPPVLECPSLQSWDSGIDFIVSNLQTLEEMWSYQPCSWPANSRGDSLLKPASPTDAQSKQHDVIKQQTRGQMSSERSAQEQPQLYSFKNQNPGACSYPIMPSESITRAAFSHSGSALPNKSNPGLPPPAIVPPGLYSVVKSKTCPDRVDNSKTSERRRTVRSADLPAPPPPSPHPPSVLNPRRPQPRPLNLVSPSQVAMASFSDSASCRALEEGNLTKLGKGQKVTHRMTPSSQHAKKARASGRPTGPCVKIECHSPEGLDRVPLSERSEYMAVSPLVIPVSVPVTVKTEADMVEIDSCHASVDVGKAQGGSKGLRRNRRLDSMKSLIIPLPVLPPLSPHWLPGQEEAGPRCRAAGGYPSQLRSPTYLTDHLLNPGFQPPPYTPPPMLSPLRPGSGLYFSTLLPPPNPCPPLSSYTATLDGADGISLVMDDTVVKIEPRINVGQRFQAEVPPLRNFLLMLYDEHPAQLVWAPWGDLSSSTETQRSVTELLDLCCSSVLPGGGTNTELALHCLHEVQGDILAALDLLLIRGDYRSSSHHLSDYHYTGSDHWTPLEKRLFRKALLTHEKDFQLIHTELRTKSVSQCVEYYYGMKKLKKFKQRSRVAGKEGAMASPGHFEDNPMGRQGPRRTLNKPDYSTMGQQDPISGAALEYACGECGRIFDRVKSRSAHMKSHRTQERQWLSGYVWASGEESHHSPSEDPHTAPPLYDPRRTLYSA